MNNTHDMAADTQSVTSPQAASDRTPVEPVAAAHAPVAVPRPTMVFASPVMDRVWSLVEAVARRDCTAMVNGESGTGKELVARQIHAMSDRAQRPFVAVDCTTLRDSLFESQMFGHEKGSFTGAQQSTLGFMRAAESGTIFLDEVGELSLENQAKLLRAIQERSVTPVGAVKPIEVDVRIIAATHRDLEKMVQRGTFRQDLFFRLNVVQLVVPPLRERIEDIKPLTQHFLGRLADLYDEPACAISDDAIAALQGFDWPGNVRELNNAVEHAFVMGGGEGIELRHLPEKLQSLGTNRTPIHDTRVLPLEVVERNVIAEALRVAGGNQNQAARMLQIRRQRLYRKVEKYELGHLTR